MAKYVCRECDTNVPDDEANNPNFKCENCDTECPCSKCDDCKLALEEGEGFWIDGEINTKNQKKVEKHMKEKKQEVVCDTCFDKILAE